MVDHNREWDYEWTRMRDGWGRGGREEGLGSSQLPLPEGVYTPVLLFPPAGHHGLTPPFPPPRPPSSNTGFRLTSSPLHHYHTFGLPAVSGPGGGGLPLRDIRNDSGGYHYPLYHVVGETWDVENANDNGGDSDGMVTQLETGRENDVSFTSDHRSHREFSISHETSIAYHQNSVV